MTNPFFTMSERYNAGTGYQWEISSKTHGVKLIGKKYVQDYSGLPGSPGTAYFKFLVQSKDYYVQLDLVSPSGKIVKNVDSTMLNLNFEFWEFFFYS